MTRNDCEIAGAARAEQDVHRVMTGDRAFWPGYPNRSVQLPDNPELRLRWLTGYAEA